MLNNLKNPLTGPIRFELWPQVRKIHPWGHCVAALMPRYVAAAGKTSQILEQDRRSWFLVLLLYIKKVHNHKLKIFLHPTLKLLNQSPFSIGTYSCNALLVTLPKSCFYSTWHWKVTGNYQRFAPPFFVNELSMMPCSQ